ncbi:MAG: hypothetical protein PWQ55_512 [Chloroflexota bacterium]|nr:hypothetical protein [Chloroflexota bacterium]
MRKLKLQVQISVDGYVAGPDGSMEWMIWNWDDDLNRYVDELTDSIDTILLGRKMAAGFIDHWSHVAGDPLDPEHEGGQKMMAARKIVYSRTVKQPIWKDMEVVSTDLMEDVAQRKEQDGKDMIVYGGASLISALLGFGLIDDLYLFVNPALVGGGRSIFGEVHDYQKLKLIESRAFDCGIVLLHYELDCTE